MQSAAIVRLLYEGSFEYNLIALKCLSFVGKKYRSEDVLGYLLVLL